MGTNTEIASLRNKVKSEHVYMISMFVYIYNISHNSQK